MKTAKYFTATWCGPCKTFKPVVIELKEEGYSIEIIDIDEHQDISVKYRISSAPTMVIEENGIEVDRFIGALPKKTSNTKINRLEIRRELSPSPLKLSFK
tara:strand:- start:76 stop:375 length:300 start_codon:yes stop_codon:yes gene_type:complete